MTNLTIISGGALRKQGKNNANAGLALINNVLDADVLQAMVNSERFTRQVQDAESVYLEGDKVTELHRSWLPNVAHADEAYELLGGIVCARTMLTPTDASAMLHYLFGAMGKRRSDEAMAKLTACVDIFSPASNMLGPALGLWESAPTHPVILAITIKQLMAEKTFEPAEAELREALTKVEQRLSARRDWTLRWRVKFDEWDRSIFEHDRPAWDKAYANDLVDSKVVLAMREWSDMSGEGPFPEDGEFPATPGSPRWQALDDLVKAKSEPRRAACKAKPAKRTRKPKPVGAESAQTAAALGHGTAKARGC